MTIGPADQRAVILDTAVQVLERRGYAGFTVREIAERARVSSKTIYRLFESRDALIVSAVEAWMAEHVYPQFTVQQDDEGPRDTAIRWTRAMFEPWARNPNMLEAFHRARAGPYGSRLARQGMAAVGPGISAIVGDGVEPARSDAFKILDNLSYGLVARFTDGQMTIAEIMPSMEQAIRLLIRDT